MEKQWHYTYNQFEVQTVGNYKKMYILSTDHYGKLQNESQNEPPAIPGIILPTIQDLLDRFEPVEREYEVRYTAWSNARGIYKGETDRFEQFLEELKENKVPRWETLVMVEFPKGSPDFVIIFPQGRKPFNNTNRDLRIAEIERFANSLQNYPQLVAVMNDALAFYTQISQTRDHQQAMEDDVKLKSDALEAQRQLVAEEMYLNLVILLTKFYKTPTDVERFFELQLIRSTTISDDDGAPVLNHIKGTIVYVLGTPFVIGLGGENGEQVVIKPGDSRSIPKTFHGNAVDFENIDYAAAGTYNFTVEGKTTAVREIHINDAQMSSFSLPDDMPILTEVVLQGNNLDQTSVNNLPIVLAKNEIINGVVSIVGGGNAVPDMSNPEVAAAISQLQARGWTILTN